ncbi:MAG: hypothetical protein KatS3mg076_2111 [Candidatus Binatia bacterium]|nr:MAG: hypothetical protein KatS3mg076_2111 [Candidatus Binatia bacterium]
MERDRAESTVRRWGSLAVVAFVFLVDGWTAGFWFHNDDFLWIHDAARATRSSDPFGPFEAGWWDSSFFRPLVHFSYHVTYRLAGTNSLPYHVTNLALHATVTLLGFRIAYRVLGASTWALVATLLFAAHPTGSAAVAWVSGRTELLCGVFYLGALLAHLHARPWVALLLFVAALCSKETAFSLPLAVAGMRLFRIERSEGKPSPVWPYFVVAGSYLLVRYRVTDEFAPGVLGLSATNPLTLDRAIGLLRGKITMLGQYLFEPLPLRGFWRSVLAFCVVFVMAETLARRGDALGRSAIRFGLFFVPVAILPYAGWQGFQPWYAYLAIWGSALAASGCCRVLFAMAGRFRCALAVFLVVWLAASVVSREIHSETERQAGVWSRAVLEEFVRRVRDPQPGTVFVVSGLERLRLGLEPGAPKALFVFGFEEGLRLAYRDSTLSVVFGDRATPLLFAGQRPKVYLRWDSRTRSFVPD